MILYATPRLHKLWLQLVQLWKEVGERKREKEKKREGETEILDCGQMIRGFHEECAANRILSSIKTRILRLMNSCSVYFLLLIYGQYMSAQKTTCIFHCFPQDCVRIVVACDVTRRLTDGKILTVTTLMCMCVCIYMWIKDGLWLVVIWYCVCKLCALTNTGVILCVCVSI